MRRGETYKVVDVREGREWTFFIECFDWAIDRLKTKYPKACIFNRYGEEV